MKTSRAFGFWLVVSAVFWASGLGVATHYLWIPHSHCEHHGHVVHSEHDCDHSAELALATNDHSHSLCSQTLFHNKKYIPAQFVASTKAETTTVVFGSFKKSIRLSLEVLDLGPKTSPPHC